MIQEYKRIQEDTISAIQFDGSRQSFNECQSVLGTALKKDYVSGEEIKLKYYGLEIFPSHWFVKDPSITTCWVVMSAEKFKNDYEVIE